MEEDGSLTKGIPIIRNESPDCGACVKSKTGAIHWTEDHQRTWRRFLAIQLFGASEEDLEDGNFIADAIAMQEVIEICKLESARGLTGNFNG